MYNVTGKSLFSFCKTFFVILLTSIVFSAQSATAQEATFGLDGGKGYPHGLLVYVENLARQQGLPGFGGSSAAAFVQSDGASGSGSHWTPGVEHTPTLRKVCDILGYRTYVRSTCYDFERSGRYPNGKCNFHSPDRNDFVRFNGSSFVPEHANPKYGKTFVATITCRDPKGQKPACQDGIDNDGDGWIDLDDPGCDGPNDDDERDPGKPQCKDGKDNDGDGKIDMADPGCDSPNDDDERDPNKPQCKDGIDNDGDGWIDMDDPGCDSPDDNDETNSGKRLTVSKTGPAQTTPGGKVTYNITVKNLTNKQINNISVSDQFLNGQSLTYIPNLSTAGCKPHEIWIVCDNFSLGAHQSKTFNLTYQVPNNIACGTQVMDQADIYINGKEGDWAKFMTQVKCQDKPQCSDGKDNDGDGWIDMDDSGCDNPNDDDETNKPQCKDGKDNDGDGKIDYPADPGCDSPHDNDETDKPQCKDGKDNDGDGKIDYPADPGCDSPHDNDETNKPQCSDGKDNDGDGWIDMDDSGCDNPNDDDETNKPQCKDGKDNDNDGKIDFPADPGCDSPHDNDETDKPQCKDGKDNDGDGKIDYPADPGCDSPHDDDEWNQETSPVLPLVECVYDLGHHKYRAFFGYENTGTQPVTVQAGIATATETNIVTPGQANRGQPSVFEVGRKKGVFFVDFDGSTITWKVQPAGANLKAISASKHSPACKPVKPIAECTDKKAGDKRRTSFGYQNDNPFDVKLDIPSFNKFIPAPEDRGQTETFFSGRSVNAFVVESGPELTWKLGQLSSAALNTLPACTQNTAPVCNAGGPYNSSCQGQQAKILLDGSKSNDPEGQPLTYLWTSDCPGGTITNATSVNAQLVIPTTSGAAVNCALWLKVSDGAETTTCDQTVKVSECNKDCLGVPGGSAQLDQCGVCNGNNACLDCKGVPFGSSKVDNCGVCGGNNSCVDCAGVPNGSAKPDDCGVCNGDGRSCLDCTSTDITNLQFQLDIGINELRLLVIKIAKRLERLPNGGTKAKKAAEAAKVEVNTLYQVAWTDIWTKLPKIIVNCANSTICTETDLSSIINIYSATDAKMRDIGLSLTRQLQTTRPASDKEGRQGDRKLAQEVNAQYASNEAVAASVPRFTSTCN